MLKLKWYQWVIIVVLALSSILLSQTNINKPIFSIHFDNESSVNSIGQVNLNSGRGIPSENTIDFLTQKGRSKLNVLIDNALILRLIRGGGFKSIRIDPVMGVFPAKVSIRSMELRYKNDLIYKINFEKVKIIHPNQLNIIKHSSLDLTITGPDPYFSIEMPPKILTQSRAKLVLQIILFYIFDVLKYILPVIFIIFIILLLFGRKKTGDIFFSFCDRTTVSITALIFCTIMILYPSIVLFRSTPMASLTWAIQDPVVSHMVYIPGRRLLSFELINNLQILWSNLRALGAPILGNELQAAPLFPLTIICHFFGDKYFWNVFIILRYFLLALGTYLLAYKTMRMHKLSSFFFMFCFAFSLYVLRWINHSYQSGLLAGIWYIYFMGASFQLSHEKSRKNELITFLGIVISAYSLVTCGFPEATALSSILILIFFVFLLIDGLVKKIIGIKHVLYLTFASFIGLGLASPQLISLVEFINGAGPDFRQNLGTSQYGSFNIFFYWITHFSFHNLPPKSPTIHTFNLIPLFLFIVGFITTLVNPKTFRLFDAIALACGVFFILKLFPVWPWFNHFIGTLPILKATWFTVYFLPIFLFFFSYYVAKGIDTLFSEFKEKTGCMNNWVPAISCYIVTLTVFYISVKTTGVNYFAQFSLAANLAVYCSFILFVITYFILSNTNKLSNTHRKRAFLYFVLIMLVIVEMKAILPTSFIPFDSVDYKDLFSIHPHATKLVQSLKEKGYNLSEIRGDEPNGRYVLEGIATVDDGAPAILPERLRRLRTLLFETGWNGYLPLEKAKYPYSWQLISRNLFYTKENQNASHLKEIAFIDGGYYYFDTKALPRAYVANKCIDSASINDSDSKIKEIGSFRLGSVYIENLDEKNKVFCRNYSYKDYRKIRILEDGGNKLQLSPISGPAVLVLNDNFYPGWSAYDRITNERFIIYPANISFRAIILPEHMEYNITFRYKPTWLYWSYFIVLLSLVCLGLVFCLYRRKRY